MHYLNEYRKAIILVDEIIQAIEKVQISINMLTPMDKFDTIKDSISSLETTKTYLEIHLAKQKRIVENKGQR